MRLIQIAHSFVFFILYFGFAEAQNYAVRHYINIEELPSNIVYDIEIAADGFLLFATDNGVVQFNGSNFSEVSYFENYKNSSIISLYKHANQSILATGCDNKIFIVHPDSSLKSISYKKGNYCFDHVFEHNKELYSYHNRYIYHLSQKTNKIEIDTQRFTLPSGHAIYSLTSFQNKLYVVVNNSLFEYKKERKIIPLKPEFKGMIFGCYAYNSTLYLSVKNSIYASKDGSNFEKIISLDEKQIIGLVFQVNENKLCFEIKDEGVFTYDLLDNKLNLLVECKQKITFIKYDYSKSLWIGTYGNGVFNISKELIKLISDSFDNQLHITDIESNGKGRIIVGTTTGLLQYDHSKESLIPLIEEYNQQYIWEVNYSDQVGKFVISTINVLNKSKISESKKFNDLLYLGSTSNYVSKDHLFIGAWNHYISYNQYNLKEQIHQFKFTEYREGAKNAPDIRVNTILQQDDNLLIGCNLGLYSSHLRTISDIKKISDENILQIKKDYNGAIWVVTPKRILKYKRNLLWEQEINLDNKLTFSDIEFMSDSNLLFIATKSGVLLKTTHNEIMLNQSLGLLSQEITSLHFDNYNKFLWIGTTKGLHYVELNEIYKNLLLVPEPYCIFHGKTILKDTLIHLAADIKSFNIQYASLAMFHFKNLKFRYRLNNTDWIYSESQSLDLLLQNPGTYKLEIASSNSGFVWSDPLNITFIKSPFFWQRLLFKIFIVALIITSIILLALLRIKQIKKREKTTRNYENQINEFKFKALSASVNPHFVFNSLNSLQYLVNANKPEIVNNYIKSFARLLRLNIDDIAQTFVSLNREIERVTNYLNIEKMRFGDKINFEFNIDENLDTTVTKVPGMILQPFVENSIKHGFKDVEKGEIKINIFKDNEFLKFEVSDNGSGISSESENRTGMGNNLVT